MARVFGAQRMVPQAILGAQGDTQAFIDDGRIAQTTRISLRDMRDWFLTWTMTSWSSSSKFNRITPSASCIPARRFRGRSPAC